MKTNEEIVFGYDPASPEGDKARVCVRHPDGTIEVFVPYAEIAEAYKRGYIESGLSMPFTPPSK